MASPVIETQILAGDIFFQNGMYKKKLNIKTASNVSYTEEIINLTKYTEGEPWSQVSLVYSIVEIDIRQSENIKSFNVRVKYLTPDHNSFKFVAEINGKSVNNRVSVCWFAREEIIDVKGEKFPTVESPYQTQKASFKLQNQVKNILHVTADNGHVNSYNLSEDRSMITVELSNGSVYATYSKAHTYKEIGKPGNYKPDSIKKINVNLHYNNNLGVMPFSGNLQLTSDVERPLNWQIGAEEIYQHNTYNYTAPGTEKGYYKDELIEQKYVITKAVRLWREHYSPYRTYYDIYAQLHRRSLVRDCVWTGNVFAQTYLYLVNVSYIKQDNSPSRDGEHITWINISPEMVIQDTINPPSKGSIIKETSVGHDYFRYVVTSYRPIGKLQGTYNTVYRVFGIQQMKVIVNG